MRKEFTKEETLQIFDAGIKILERDGWCAGGMHRQVLTKCSEGEYCAYMGRHADINFPTLDQAQRQERCNRTHLWTDLDVCELTGKQNVQHCILGAFEAAGVELGLIDPYSDSTGSESTLEDWFGADYERAVEQVTGCDTLYEYNDGFDEVGPVLKAVEDIRTILS